MGDAMLKGRLGAETRWGWVRHDLVQLFTKNPNCLIEDRSDTGEDIEMLTL